MLPHPHQRVSCNQSGRGNCGHPDARESAVSNAQKAGEGGALPSQLALPRRDERAVRSAVAPQESLVGEGRRL